MENRSLLYYMIGAIVGIITIFLIVQHRETKKTKVVIKGEKVTFESNQNKDGDTYEIIVEKDTIKGIYFNEKWN